MLSHTQTRPRFVQGEMAKERIRKRINTGLNDIFAIISLAKSGVAAEDQPPLLMALLSWNSTSCQMHLEILSDSTGGGSCFWEYLGKADTSRVSGIHHCLKGWDFKNAVKREQDPSIHNRNGWLVLHFKSGVIYFHIGHICIHTSKPHSQKQWPR